MGVFDELVSYPGIKSVPKGQRDGFIRSQRADIQSSIRRGLDTLKSTFPAEFSAIKGIQVPDELSEILDEVHDSLSAQPTSKSVRLPPGLAEYLLLTYNTTPATTATFGLPTLSPTPHPKPYGQGYAQLEMDFDSDIDDCCEEFGFYICLDPAKEEFGTVVVDKFAGKKFRKVAESFEEFFAAFVEFMEQDFAPQSGTEDQKAAVEDWYLRYAEDE
ncbi:hypothetical protein HDV00_000372 [Rhizophlyctis rosea]|nr:hypothetical protein HDV00_000372 [Rhizophlyctis rosea]